MPYATEWRSRMRNGNSCALGRRTIGQMSISTAAS
jgi:hypothetical protein